MLVVWFLQGYKTGYVYKQPIVKQETRKDRLNSDVEVPPASSSFTYVFDGDYEHSKYMWVLLQLESAIMPM